MKANLAKIKSLRSEASKLEKQCLKGIHIKTLVPTKHGKKVTLNFSNFWLTFNKGLFYPCVDDLDITAACELSKWVEDICQDECRFYKAFTMAETTALIMAAKKKEFSAIDKLLKTLTPEEFEAFTHTWDEYGHCNAKDFMSFFNTAYNEILIDSHD